MVDDDDGAFNSNVIETLFHLTVLCVNIVLSILGYNVSFIQHGAVDILQVTKQSRYRRLNISVELDPVIASYFRPVKAIN